MVGVGVNVEVSVAVGISVAFTPHAESVNPAEVAPASFRKSRLDNGSDFVIATSLFFDNYDNYG
jgi:hypothetical protein